MNNTKLNPSQEERLVGIMINPVPHDKGLAMKFKYTILFMIHFIHTNKLQNKSILIQDFVDKMFRKFRFKKMRWGFLLGWRERVGDGQKRETTKKNELVTKKGGSSQYKHKAAMNT